jgi:hypothetical protein
MASGPSLVPAEKAVLFVQKEEGWQAAAPPGPDTVLCGSDGYLFERRYDSIEQIAGRLTLSQTQVAAFAVRVSRVNDACRQRGIRYYILIVPEKYVVYPDKLPPQLTVSDQRPAARIVAGLPVSLRNVVMYPDAILRSNRSPFETYDQTDSHWNSFGAFVTYVELHAALCRDGVALTPLITSIARGDYWKVGDLGIRLTPEQVERAIRLTSPDSVTVSRTFSQNRYRVGQVDLFETQGAPPLRAVMFRDSNGSLILPFLTQHFARTVAVATDRMCYDLLAAERPDVVITQIAERALCQRAPDGGSSMLFPDGLASTDFSSLTGVPLPLPAA